MSNFSAYYKNINRGPQSQTNNRARQKEIDIHEIQKQEIYRQGMVQENSYNVPQNLGQIQPVGRSSDDAVSTSGFALANSIYGPEDIPFYLDSFIKTPELSNYTNGQIGFRLEPLNNNRRLTSFVQMTIGSFYFPQVKTFDGPLFDTFFYNRVYLNIINFPQVVDNATVITSNFVPREAQRFHFEFEIENIGGAAIKLVPIKPTFNLPRPVPLLDNIIFGFQLPPISNSLILPPPFRNIKLPSDTLRITLVPEVQPPTRAPGEIYCRLRITPDGIGSDVNAITELGPASGPFLFANFAIPPVPVVITSIIPEGTPPTQLAYDGRLLAVDERIILGTPGGSFALGISEVMLNALISPNGINVIGLDRTTGEILLSLPDIDIANVFVPNQNGFLPAPNAPRVLGDGVFSFTQITGPGSYATNFFVTVPKNRIAIPITFTSIRTGQQTNYLTPVTI